MITCFSASSCSLACGVETLKNHNSGCKCWMTTVQRGFTFFPLNCDQCSALHVHNSFHVTCQWNAVNSDYLWICIVDLCHSTSVNRPAVTHKCFSVFLFEIKLAKTQRRARFCTFSFVCLHITPYMYLDGFWFSYGGRGEKRSVRLFSVSSRCSRPETRARRNCGCTTEVL